MTQGYTARASEQHRSDANPDQPPIEITVTRSGAALASGRYLADVYAYYRGNKSLQPAVVAELRSKPGRWVFVNFHYVNASADPENENLLSILAVLRADRVKGK